MKVTEKQKDTSAKSGRHNLPATEKVLLAGEERFRNLMEHIPGVSIQGYNLKGTVLYWNKASEGVYGYTAREAIGQNLCDLIIPPAIKPLFRKALELGKKTKRSGELMPPGEIMLLHKDRHLVPVYSIHTIVRVKGEKTLLFCIDVDLSERKQAEEALRRSYEEMEFRVKERTAKLTHANLQLESEIRRHRRTELALRESEEHLRQGQKLEAVGRLASGVAHDFGNLLNAINGYIALFKLKLSPQDPLRPEIIEVEKVVRRAEKLIRKLLAFGRKEKTKPKAWNINEIINDLKKMLRQLLGRGVKLQTSLDPELGIIQADRGQIEQIIINLSLNAQQAIKRRGTIRISTSNCRLKRARRGLTPGSYILLTISDTGCGMSKEVQRHIFEPFFTTNKNGDNSGLGLSIIYGIVKQSGGQIKVESKAGQGTVFKIYLPRV